MKALCVATILACVVCEGGGGLILIGGIQEALGYDIPGDIVQKNSEMPENGPTAAETQAQHGQNHDEEHEGDHEYEKHRHHDDCENEKAGLYIYISLNRKCCPSSTIFLFTSFINFISEVIRYKNCNKTEDMQSALMCKAHVGARRTYGSRRASISVCQ